MVDILFTWLCTVVQFSSPSATDADQSESFSAGVADDRQTVVVPAHVSSGRRCQLTTPDHCAHTADSHD